MFLIRSWVIKPFNNLFDSKFYNLIIVFISDVGKFECNIFFSRTSFKISRIKQNNEWIT